MNAAVELEPRDLAQLIERLRHAGLRVDTRQYLAAHELLLAFAERGRDLQAEPQAYASHLGPIFCTSVEDQRLFDGEFRRWWGVPPPPSPPTAPLEKTPGKHRWVSTGAIVLIVVAVVLGAILLGLFLIPDDDPQIGPGPPPVVQPTQAAPPAQAPSDIRVGPAERVGGGQFAVAQQSRVTSPWLVAGGGGLACALVVLGVVWALQKRRRDVALKRLPDTGDPDLVTISPPVADFVDLPPAQLLRIATGMRRARAQSSVSLCLEATVEVTARSGGFVTPAFAPRLATSEYLVLIERRGPEDHLHHLTQRWIDQLRGHDVAADCFDFHTDPRVCADSQTLRRYRLADLLARYHRAVVLIHAETSTLFDEITGQPQQWLEPLLSMTACVLLTPTPKYRWRQREKALVDAGVVVLPATPAGLQIVASMGNEWRQPNDLPSRYTRDFPRVITNRDTRWLDRSEPPKEAILVLVEQVNGFLGPVGYLWLCACAVYPQISWATTLALLPDVVEPGDEVGRRRAIEECLPSLARLPWFRAGYMPDWLRSLLISNLPAEKEAAVRDRLGRLVVDLVRKRDGATKPAAGALDIAKSLTALDVARAAPEGSPLGDRVFLGFLAGANPDPLTLALPGSSRSSGPRQRGMGEKILGHWRAFTQLRPAMARGVAALLVGVLSAGALWKVSPTKNIPVPFEAAELSYLFLGPAGFSDGAVMAAIAPNGKFMAISYGTGRQGAVLWDAVASKAVATLAPDDAVMALAISPDSRLVGALDANLKVHVWDAAGNTVGEPMAVPNGSLPSASLSFNRDGTLLAVGAGNYASVFDIQKKSFTGTIYASTSSSASPVAQQAQADEPLRVSGVDFGLQPALLAVAFGDHIQLTDVARTGVGESLKFSGPASSPPPVAMSADGRYIATVQSPLVRSPDNDTVLVWERGGTKFTGAGAAEPLSILRSAVPGVFLAWSPRGEMLAYGQSDGRLRLVDPKHAAERAEFDSGTLEPLAPNQKALYSVRFTTALNSVNTTYVVERRTLEIDPASVAPTDTLSRSTSQTSNGVKKPEPPVPVVPGPVPAQRAAKPPVRTAQKELEALRQRVQKQNPQEVRQQAQQQTAQQAEPASSAAGQTAANEAARSKAPPPSESANARAESNAQADLGTVRARVVLQKDRFVLPTDGAPPSPTSFPRQFCCEGYVAELRDSGGNVVGFIQLTFSNGGSGPFSGELANRVRVSAYVIRPDAAGGAVDPLKADYDRSDSDISVDDYMKDDRHRESNDAGRLRFTVSILKASVVKGGFEKSPVQSKAPTAALRPGAYFNVSSVQVQVTAADRQYTGQSKK
ncbi:MAG: hypothetical protein WDO68_23265 [Gammaproteobacteria bacterium]